MKVKIVWFYFGFGDRVYQLCESSDNGIDYGIFVNEWLPRTSYVPDIGVGEYQYFIFKDKADHKKLMEDYGDFVIEKN